MRMSGLRFSVASVLTVALVLGACADPVVVVPDQILSVWSMIPQKCPGHGKDSFPQLVLPAEITNVPEYNDCQRFIIGPSYDSIYAVFVASNAASAITRLKALECLSSARLSNGEPAPRRSDREGVRLSPLYSSKGTPADTSAVMDNPNFTRSLDCRGKPGQQWNSVGISVAEIVSLGGIYAPLGIKPKFNCLYIFDSAALKAIMRPVDADEKLCLEVVDPATVQGTPLLVRATSRAGLGPDDYPPVARWDTDPKTRHLYISMICGEKWCEVGQQGLTSSQQYSSTSPDPVERRVVEVKGWYDEQRLAKIEGGKAVPSDSLGTMIPESALHGYQPEDFLTDVLWRRAAKLVIRQKLQKYKDDLNLDRSTGLQRWNQGWLCTGSLERCIPEADQPTVQSCTSGWFGRILSADGDTRYKCVKMHPHEGLSFPVPGTVRWAWYDRDEGGWIRCPGGCCYPS